jgi:hypothetical protein
MVLRLVPIGFETRMKIRFIRICLRKIPCKKLNFSLFSLGRWSISTALMSKRPQKMIYMAVVWLHDMQVGQLLDGQINREYAR